ncbi:MAG: hypothetical protein A6F71_10760 [Cycloclasticus sp. symbiont of Poecilosclerida sp. M]|nr:MAG: hypothetical protein A6F71_10760 [Cycloclasticus sp. symbiont of Poecilosclerida sp. M]
MKRSVDKLVSSTSADVKTLKTQVDRAVNEIAGLAGLQNEIVGLQSGMDAQIDQLFFSWKLDEIAEM